MRAQFAARVIGHELIESDKPKAGEDQMKVKLAVRPVSALPGKSTSASLTVSYDEARVEYPLKRILLITIEESQKDLFAAVDGAEKPRRSNQQTEIGLPRGDSPVAKPPERGTVTPMPRRTHRRRAGAPATTVK